MGKIRQVTTRVMQPSPSPRTQAQVASTTLNPDTKFLKYQKLIAYQMGTFSSGDTDQTSMYDPANLVTFGGDYLNTDTSGDEYLSIPPNMIQVPTVLEIKIFGTFTATPQTDVDRFRLRVGPNPASDMIDTYLPTTWTLARFEQFTYVAHIPLKNGTTTAGYATLSCEVSHNTEVTQDGLYTKTVRDGTTIAYDGTAPINLYIEGKTNTLGSGTNFQWTVYSLQVSLYN